MTKTISAKIISTKTILGLDEGHFDAERCRRRPSVDLTKAMSAKIIFDEDHFDEDHADEDPVEEENFDEDHFWSGRRPVSTKIISR